MMAKIWGKTEKRKTESKYRYALSNYCLSFSKYLQNNVSFPLMFACCSRSNSGQTPPVPEKEDITSH